MILLKLELTQHYNRPKKTNLGEMILFEHVVNLFNAPLIFMMLLRLTVPAPLVDLLRTPVVCVAMEVIMNVTSAHRGFGGLGIAIMRLVENFLEDSIT